MAGVAMRRRLDLELVRRGLVDTRARANEAIAAGRVLVDGAPADRPARQVSPAEQVTVRGEPPRFVSRGGEKLDAALATFPIAVEGRRALDVGASTGGFTDCLLQHGAAHVYAVDVGRGQLAWSLRGDPRVTLLERTNARGLEPGAIDGPVPLAVADVSFISLRTVAPALARVTTPDADLVLLAKPQFEAGRGRVPRGGVVRDAAVHADVLRTLAVGLEEGGLPVVAATASPLLGADGNREFLLWVRRGQPAAEPAAVAALAEEAAR
ncbi:MAG TPA: TlyA family RNA methyltransferase [Acidimicrobiia bacterium]|nr:TlyA family RNA methyltransferase [Acidimicrobiia bacterium]